MEISLHGIVAHAIADYLGDDRELTRVECVPDPEVPGVYALRVAYNYRDTTPDPLEFIVRGVRLHQVTVDDLEECEFASWPPRSR